MSQNKVMNKIVFATNNAHKLEELRAIAGGKLEVVSLADIGCHDDIPEDAPTLEGNALAKAEWVCGRYGIPCFADDTGLEVDALDGAPGVHSARYAGGAGHDSAANTALLLKNMKDVAMPQRTARFRTIIALVYPGGEKHLFEGKVEGLILTAPDGNGGFGYDPVFAPVEWGGKHSFASAGADEKNAISHRGRATRALMDFLLDPSRTDAVKPENSIE